MNDVSNEALAIRIKQGEKDLLPLLWQQCKKYIAWKARKLISAFQIKSGNTRGCTIDDLIQQGYFALLAAVDYFDGNSGNKFITALNFFIKSSFADAMGFRLVRIKNDPLNDALSLDTPVNEEGDCTMVDLLLDEMTEGPGSVEELAINDLYIQQLHSALEASLTRLTAQQQEVIRKKYYENMSCSQVAGLKDLTPQGVNYIEHAALTQMYDSREITGLSEFVEKHTHYHQTVGIRQFKSTWTSSVEKIILRREELANKWLEKRRRERQENH